ncbi:MAG: DNA polymerase III subunit delta [Betaproteobacteria bacterium]|nr:DNA polymerase III subunit delta [Betaproteobacteria bacterium]
MQLRAEQLEQHLQKSLAPLYVIHGDEPLIALEAADAVRAAARRRGLDEREVYTAERGFDWSALAHAGASRSLFGGGKLVELRMPGGKPGTDGAATLVAYCGRLDPEMLTLVSLPRVDRAGQSSAWFNALAAAGVVVEVWPVERVRLPQWIGARLARQAQKASPEVLEFLATRVEGNLLAAHQEVQKLALLAPPGELALDTVEDAVASVARYDPYAAAEALVAGDFARYVRVLQGLRGEGEAPTFVLFAIASALFVLRGMAEGKSAERLFGEQRLYNKPLQRAVQAAARRYARATLDAALSQAALIDRAIKGVARGDPWDHFTALGLKLTGGSKA